VENYRKLTKIPKPVFNAISIRDWMDSISLLFSERVEKEAIDFKVLNEYKGETFLGDQKLLTQVVINLLNNGADAMKNVNMKKLFIHISGSDQEYISIKFADNGKGIAPEFMDQIFMPFFTTKENGSGIGLSLSLQIIKLHKGKLTVRSIPELETVFEIKI
jgi:signal transduction histidine kinase